MAALDCFFPLAFLLGWGVALLLGSGAGEALSGSCTGLASLARGFPGPGSLFGTGLLTDCSRLSPDGATDADCMTGVDSSLIDSDVLLVAPLGGQPTTSGREMVTPSWARDC